MPGRRHVFSGKCATSSSLPINGASRFDDVASLRSELQRRSLGTIWIVFGLGISRADAADKLLGGDQESHRNRYRGKSPDVKNARPHVKLGKANLECSV
jgi:hypothetical protein